MIIKVKVKPNSGKEEIEKVSENEFIVSLKKPAEDNKANLELLKIMKKYFKQEISIVRGLKSREKFLKLENGN
jgi:uncharacterized protein (TIGR00251 family)